MLRLIFWCVFGLSIKMSLSSKPAYFTQGQEEILRSSQSWQIMRSEDCEDPQAKQSLFAKFHQAVSKVKGFFSNAFYRNVFRERINKLVFGGNKVKIEKYPHQVSLYYKNHFLCGGSIISDRFILTAAHCLDNTDPNPKKWKVGTGSSYLSEDDVTYCISKYFVHPRYNPRTVDYDIAILETSRRIDLNGRTIKAVRLPDLGRPLLPGENVVITGYGSMTGRDEPSIQLRAVTLPVISTEYCDQAWLSTYGQRVTPRMFCAGHDKGGKSGCYRDSGGPVVSADSLVQYGIVSFGPEGCNERGIPNVFTNIAEVRRWITKITGL